MVLNLDRNLRLRATLLHPFDHRFDAILGTGKGGRYAPTDRGERVVDRFRVDGLGWKRAKLGVSVHLERVTPLHAVLLRAPALLVLLDVEFCGFLKRWVL